MSNILQPIYHKRSGSTEPEAQRFLMSDPALTRKDLKDLKDLKD